MINTVDVEGGNKNKSFIRDSFYMSIELTGYVKEFVVSEPVKSKLKDIVLYIGNQCETEGTARAFPPSTASRTEMDLLVGSRILEQLTGRTFKLTEERGEKIYKILKLEMFKES